MADYDRRQYIGWVKDDKMKYVSNVYGALYANFYLIYIVCNFLSDKIDQLLPPVMFFGQLTITQLQQ